jgi:hypothetical protein
VVAFTDPLSPGADVPIVIKEGLGCLHALMLIWPDGPATVGYGPGQLGRTHAGSPEDNRGVAVAHSRILVALALLLMGAGRKPLADLSVREMRSARVDGKVLRAVKGYSEIYPFLVVEMIQPGQDEAEEPVLVGTWALRDMEGWKVEAAMEGDDIGDFKWRGPDLEFLYLGTQGVLACTISRIEEKRPKVHCQEGAGKAGKRPTR